jgi:hypothetical protein
MVALFDHSRYVPCVRWKMGEYQALLRLTGSAKRAITPLIEVPEIGWDFENSQGAKSIDEHIAKVPGRLITKWGSRDFFLDCKLIETEAMADRSHPVEWIHSRLKDLQKHVCHVAHLNTSSVSAVAIRKIVNASPHRLALRLTLSDFARPELQQQVRRFLEYHRVSATETHLIFDLEAPNFEPFDGFSKMLSAISAQIPFLKDWATFTLLGTSFPASMGALTKGAHELPRHEWIAYKAILSHEIPFGRVPTFGDYCIAHPAVVTGDMRLIKPAASIRYTINDRWLVIKGSAFRKNPQQVCTFSKNLVASPYFMGSGFSQADEHISKCAQGSVGPGNLSTWRWVGTTHHIEKIASDLASLSDLAADA